jgi:hypothetical protein
MGAAVPKVSWVTNSATDENISKTVATYPAERLCFLQCQRQPKEVYGVERELKTKGHLQN